MPAPGPLLLEDELQRQLYLARIAHALTQEAVEIEQPRRYQRVDVVVVVERVEHLNRRNHRIPLVEPDRPQQPPIEREVLIVLSETVAVCRGPHVGRDRLRAASLDPEIAVYAPEHLHVGIEVELVPDVAVRKGIIQL